MPEPIDYTEIPYLQEILSFLPIDPVDDEDVISYIQNITNLIAVNYKYGQYQFAYFGIHLLYMTYIYCSAWKISQINPVRYKDVMAFARVYSGREKEIRKVMDADSIFAYSLIPEKDIAKIFKVTELDESQIKVVSDIVDIRNDMAHASGKFEILTEEGYEVKTNSIRISINNIHKSIDKLIRQWYSEVLLSYCAGEYSDYEDPKDIIVEQMIQNFKLSVKELLVCSEMSVSGLITQHRGYESKLRNFKQIINLYCHDMEYM